jgi:hypothetical protein
MTIATHTPLGHVSIVRQALEAERIQHLRARRTAESVRATQRIDDALVHLDAVRTALISKKS